MGVEGRGWAYLLGGLEIGDGVAGVEAAVAGGEVVGEDAEVFLAFGICGGLEWGFGSNPLGSWEGGAYRSRTRALQRHPSSPLWILVGFIIGLLTEGSAERRCCGCSYPEPKAWQQPAAWRKIISSSDTVTPSTYLRP